MSATSLSTYASHDLPPTASHGSPRPLRKRRLEDDDTDLAQMVAKKVKEYLLDFKLTDIVTCHQEQIRWLTDRTREQEDEISMHKELISEQQLEISNFKEQLE